MVHRDAHDTSTVRHVVLGTRKAVGIVMNTCPTAHRLLKATSTRMPIAIVCDVVAKALELLMERRFGLLRLGRWEKRARIELSVVSVAPLEPDREFARHAELCKASPWSPLPS